MLNSLRFVFFLLGRLQIRMHDASLQHQSFGNASIYMEYITFRLLLTYN